MNNIAENVYIFSAENKEDKKYFNILSAADKTGTEVNFINPYEKAYTGNIEIKYIYPPDNISSEINSSGILLEIDLNGKRILYADGLTETDLRYIMFGEADIKCDVLYLIEYEETEFFSDAGNNRCKYYSNRCCNQNIKPNSNHKNSKNNNRRKF